MIINVQPEARTSLKSQITKRVPQLEANQPVPDGTVRSSRCRPGPFWRLLLSAPSFSCKKRRALVSSLLFAPSFRTATSSSSFAIASPLTCTLYFAMVLVNRTLASGHLAITDLDIPGGMVFCDIEEAIEVTLYSHKSEESTSKSQFRRSRSLRTPSEGILNLNYVPQGPL
ncbi:hypothetical protein NLI96_g7706 [Meripilus lineatus]|uniref:Uncharacterized protein n=1 Tax=Meripilus lineatus TaxID=2056292 RepID=A0AAD5YCP8_9APHY|nr:hypothetical protein NLI96_g7706 [Physisporinus lineatus]